MVTLAFTVALLKWGALRLPKRTITNDWIASKCGWTPFDGMKVVGWPAATIIRGHIVVRDHEPQAPQIGSAVRFIDTGG